MEVGVNGGAVRPFFGCESGDGTGGEAKRKVLRPEKVGAQDDRQKQTQGQFRNEHQLLRLRSGFRLSAQNADKAAQLRPAERDSG